MDYGVKDDCFLGVCAVLWLMFVMALIVVLYH